MATRRIKHLYLQTLGITVMLLALIRCAFPGIARQNAPSATLGEVSDSTATEQSLPAEAPVTTVPTIPSSSDYTVPELKNDWSVPYLAEGAPPHPIKSVPGYAESFPDSNHVQLVAAQYWGVSPVKDRDDAESRMNELVYMGSSPYYIVAHLESSIPYLVPRAAILLEDISRNFLDSLHVKGLPLHRLIVSSVLRTQADVNRLRRSNHNATEQSCHLYGTTFDINYNVYSPVGRHEAPNDKLKFILSEVLRDLRQQGRCYIKYEVRQPCFHITVR